MSKLAIDSRQETIPTAVWAFGVLFRTLFILILMVMTARVASPQIESIWSAHETPNELVRMLLGFAVCLFLLFQIFKLPKDPAGYRIWLYLGLFVVPLASVCAIATW